MELKHADGKLYVNYGDRLVTLMREVRTLTSLGFAVPARIQHTAAVGEKFYRHGIVLKQVRTGGATRSAVRGIFFAFARWFFFFRLLPSRVGDLNQVDLNHWFKSLIKSNDFLIKINDLNQF